MPRRPSQSEAAVRARASRDARRARGRPLPADVDAAIALAVAEILARAGCKHGIRTPGVARVQAPVAAIAKLALESLMRRQAEDGAPRYDEIEVVDAIAARLDPSRLRA